MVAEVALEAKRMRTPVIGVISVERCQASLARHSSGRKRPDVADVMIDNCTPGGDALVRIPGLEDAVGPGSTIGTAAEKLAAPGKPPLVLTSSYFIPLIPPAFPTRSSGFPARPELRRSPSLAG